MKKLIIIISLFVLPFISWTQVLTFGFQQHTFQNTNENELDSIVLTLSNITLDDIAINDVVGFEQWQKQAFYTSDTSFIIPANGNYQLSLFFSPSQNTFYDSEIILESEKHGFFNLDLKGQGQFSNSYYSASQNLEEEALKTALKTIISNQYTQLSYNNARDLMYMMIDNQMLNGGGASQNTLECVYTGRIISGYQNRTQAQQSPHDFNTEHTYPQSLFSSALPMKSDLFHLFPTDMTSNSVRSNYPFGNVSGTPSWQVGGSKLSNSIFEPRGEQKGNVARAMMYFVIRYQDYNNFYSSQDLTLRQWNDDYLPDSTELNRNNAIYSYQNNRNPFIDYPQLAYRISNFSSFSSSPAIKSIQNFPDTVDFGLINEADTFVYHSCFVNTGNQNIELNSISVSDTTSIKLLTVLAGDSIIAPGESYCYKFKLAFDHLSFPGGLIDETIELHFNDAVLVQKDIPVLANVTFTSLEDTWQNADNIFIQDNLLKLNLDERNAYKSIEIYELSGKQIMMEKLLSPSNRMHINISNWPSGMYLIKLNQKNGYIRSLKFIK